MADGVKISEFPEIEELQAGCCFPIISDGENRRITYKSLKNQLMNEINGYSTNEKIIGRWIDGRPIYKIAIPLSSGTRESDVLGTWRKFTIPNAELVKFGGTDSIDTFKLASSVNLRVSEPSGDLTKQYAIFIYIKAGV